MTLDAEKPRGPLSESERRVVEFNERDMDMWPSVREDARRILAIDDAFKEARAELAAARHEQGRLREALATEQALAKGNFETYQNRLEERDTQLAASEAVVKAARSLVLFVKRIRATTGFATVKELEQSGELVARFDTLDGAGDKERG